WKRTWGLFPFAIGADQQCALSQLTGFGWRMASAYSDQSSWNRCPSFEPPVDARCENPCRTNADCDNPSATCLDDSTATACGTSSASCHCPSATTRKVIVTVKAPVGAGPIYQLALAGFVTTNPITGL